MSNITNIHQPENKLLQLCRDKQLTLSVAESCTGGSVAARLTSVSGASDYFQGGIVAYSNDVKNKILNVPQDILDKYTAVSREAVLSMLEGTLKLFNTNLCLAISGVAGPLGGTVTTPVGTIFIAMGGNIIKTETYEFHLQGDRQSIIAQAVDYSLQVLLEALMRSLDVE